MNYCSLIRFAGPSIGVIYYSKHKANIKNGPGAYYAPEKRDIFAGRQNSRQTLPSARWGLEVDPQGELLWWCRGILPIIEIKAPKLLVLTLSGAIEVICRHAVANDD